jgi:squalene synthase HpnC
MRFEDDLARYGPDATYEHASLDVARAYCAALTRSHYENFHVVTALTPAHLRPAFEAIYAFCRWSDDLGDEIGDPARSLELLAWWRGELAAMYGGRARHPVSVALAPVVTEFNIPARPFEALISAFEQDQAVLDYETYDQLLDYCARSANPVGHLVLHLGRSFTLENAALSDFTCTGLQLANFWQDVARDRLIGRTYLPREDRERFGVTAHDLATAPASLAFRSLLAFEVGRARALLHDGWPLVGRMPRDLAVDLDLFTRGGLAILDRIAAVDFDVLTARPKLGKAARLGLLTRALAGRFLGLRPRPLARREPPAALIPSARES